MKRWPLWMTVAVWVGATACSQLAPGDEFVPADAAVPGADARVDAGFDAGVDAGHSPSNDATVDAGVDDRDAGAPDAVADSGVSVAPSTARQSNGSGNISSATYRMSITVGGPSPAGSASSPNYRLYVGPNAAGN